MITTKEIVCIKHHSKKISPGEEMEVPHINNKKW